jgi:hypothetical protein
MSPAVRFALIAGGAGLLIFSAQARADQAHEYAEVRKIALKDPKVQAAFDRANEKLDERILEIDPTLKPYMDKLKGHPAETAKPAAAKPVKQPPQAANTHIVAKGETLSSIALEYKVSVSSLKSANSIADERKLRVGRKLIIPAQSPAPSAPAARHHEETTKKEPSLWDRLQNSF